jgi:hypothetical protein
MFAYSPFATIMYDVVVIGHGFTTWPVLIHDIAETYVPK